MGDPAPGRMCGRYLRPTTDTSSALPIHASFDRSWEAVIEFFSEHGIGIKTLEKASGLVVAEPMTPADTMANCGGDDFGPVRPTEATFNVFVRGTTDTATVLVSARFLSVRAVNDPRPTVTCSTTGYFETMLEQSIRGRAEQQP